MFPYRYLMWGIAFCCLTSIASNLHIINFSAICMDKDETGLVQEGNRTFNKLNYPEIELSYLSYAMGMGTLLATYPVNMLCVKYGVRVVFFVCGLISAASTALIPFGANFHFIFFLFLRFLQGIGYAADFATIGVICVRWAPLNEYSLFIAFMTAFTPISSTVSNKLTSSMCTTSTTGWRYSYYIHAAAGLVIFVVWFFVYSDEPRKCKHVTEKELDDIHEGKSKAHIDGDKYVPYKAIFKNRIILVVWFNAFADLICVQFVLQYAPIYFKKLLGFDLDETGTLTSFLGLVTIPFKFACAFASDKSTFLSEKTKMIIFNNLGVGLCGILMVILGFLPSEHRVWSIVTFYLISTVISANCGGFYKCGTYVSRQHAHFVLATIQFMKCIALFIAPSLVGLFVHDNSVLSEWRVVFLIQAALLLVANFLFWAINSDQPAEFTKLTGREENDNKTHTCE